MNGIAKLIDIFAENHPDAFVKFVSKLAELGLLELPKS